MARTVLKHNLMGKKFGETSRYTSDTKDLVAFMSLLCEENNKFGQTAIAKENGWQDEPCFALTPDGVTIGILHKLEYRLQDNEDKTTIGTPVSTSLRDTYTRKLNTYNIRYGTYDAAEKYIKDGLSHADCEMYWPAVYHVFEAYGLKLIKSPIGENIRQLEFLGRYCYSTQNPHLRNGAYIDSVSTVLEYTCKGVAKTLQRHAFNYIQKHEIIKNDILVELDSLKGISTRMLYTGIGMSVDKPKQDFYERSHYNLIPYKKIVRTIDDYSPLLKCPLHVAKPRVKAKNNKIMQPENERIL